LVRHIGYFILGNSNVLGWLYTKFNVETIYRSWSIKIYFLRNSYLQLKPFYAMRAVGGTLFLIGMLVMVYNVYKTVKTGTLVADEAAEAAPLEKEV
jgi:cytochrome c oxidase cbb3-type subunit I/II